MPKYSTQPAIIHKAVEDAIKRSNAKCGKLNYNNKKQKKVTKKDASTETRKENN